MLLLYIYLSKADRTIYFMEIPSWSFQIYCLGTLKLISKFIDNKGFSGTKRYFGDLGKTVGLFPSKLIQ